MFNALVPRGRTPAYAQILDMGLLHIQCIGAVITFIALINLI